MSLLLLFHGAAVAAVVRPPVGTGNFPAIVKGKASLGVALTTAVVATTLTIWPPQPPQFNQAPPSGWDQTPSSDYRVPAHRIRPRSVALLHEYSRAPLPFPAPPNGWDQCPSSDQRAPVHRIRPQLSTAAVDTSRQPYLPPTPPPLDLTPGWDETPNSDQRTPAHRIRPRSVDLLTEYSLGLLVPDTPTGWDQVSSSETRPPAHRLKARSVELLGAYSFVAQPPAAIVATTPSDYWFWRWEDPPKAPARTVQLRDQFAWAPQYFTEYQEGWRSRFLEPPKAAPRSVDLLGQVIWAARPPIVEYQNGWQSLFPEPPKAAPRPREVLGQVVWAAQEPTVVFQEGWRQEFSKPQRLAPLPRLQGAISWAVEIPFVEYQNGWQSLFQGPPVFQAARRATNLLESWPWPGYGFFLVPPGAPTPSDLWFTRWQDPPKAKPRSVALLGQVIWSARVPIVEFQTGWGSAFSQPPAYAKARRAVDLLSSYSYPYRVPEIVYQEGWRSAYSQPPALLRNRPRLQGAISIVLEPPVPAAATPSSLGFYVHWQEPAVYLQRPRALALQLGWAQWPPQLIVQVTPPTARPGVTIRLGYGDTPRAKAGTLVSGFVKTTTRRHGKATTGTVPLAKQATGITATAIEEETTLANLMDESGSIIEPES